MHPNAKQEADERQKGEGADESLEPSGQRILPVRCVGQRWAITKKSFYGLFEEDRTRRFVWVVLHRYSLALEAAQELINTCLRSKCPSVFAVKSVARKIVRIGENAGVFLIVGCPRKVNPRKRFGSPM